MKKPIPFNFVLDLLDAVGPTTKPMFGCISVYVDDKIVLILREKDNNLADNGVWLATTTEHHASLQKDFPNMRSLALFGPGPTGWQILPADAPDFEESVTRACEMILRKDARLGKIPARRKSRKSRAAGKKIVKKVSRGQTKNTGKIKPPKRKPKPVRKKKR